MCCSLNIVLNLHIINKILDFCKQNIDCHMIFDFSSRFESEINNENASLSHEQFFWLSDKKQVTFLVKEKILMPSHLSFSSHFYSCNSCNFYFSQIIHKYCALLIIDLGFTYYIKIGIYIWNTFITNYIHD